MTTAQTVLAAALDDINIIKIRELLNQVGGQESQTVEFKEAKARTIARSVAAMANSYGGLILVGVSDSGTIVGVDDKSADAVSSHCWEKIEPPWVPETIPVPLDDGSGKYVLVLRIDPERCPRRPLVVDGAAYVRYNATTRPASWYELRDMFVEQASTAVDGLWSIQAPQIPNQLSEVDASTDLMVRTGIVVPVTPPARWRPLSEQTTTAFAHALDKSTLSGFLDSIAMGDVGQESPRTFAPEGLNRARTARLRRWGVPESWPTNLSKPVEAIASVDVPGAYGSNSTHLTFLLDIMLRSGTMLQGPTLGGRPQFPWAITRIRLKVLAQLLDALIATCTDPAVIGCLATMAAVDPNLVPQPRTLHIVSTRQIRDVLAQEGLSPIPSAGASTGAHMTADPALDLADPEVRHEQVKTWLVQLAMDAGLAGAEAAVAAQVRFPDDPFATAPGKGV